MDIVDSASASHTPRPEKDRLPEDQPHRLLSLVNDSGASVWDTASLLHLFKPLVEEAGPALARLLLGKTARDASAVACQTLLLEHGGDFVAAFQAFGHRAAACGWGTLELRLLQLEPKRGIVRVQNALELRLHQGEAVRWGCPFLLGRLCGLFATAFHAPCWAEERSIEGEPLAVDFYIYESGPLLDNEIQKLREQRLSGQAEPLIEERVLERTLELRYRDLNLHQVLRLSPNIIYTIDQQGLFRVSGGTKLAALGLAPGQLVGLSVFEFYKDYPSICENIRAVLTGEERSWDVNVGDVYFETQCVPLRNDSSQIIGALGVATDISERMTAQNELRARHQALEAELREKQRTILLLSTPVLRVWDGILLLPLVGQFDKGRATQFMDALLQAIADHQASEVLLDITGISGVDTTVAYYLLQSVQAARLLGVHCTLVGISAAVAQTLVHLGSDLSKITTYATLEAGLKQALARLHYQVGRPPRAGF
jgi:rsbT co-antagonist protein RsbR